jgi:hypothetical protein
MRERVARLVILPTRRWRRKKVADWKANRGKGTNGVRKLATSTLTSTEYDQNTSGSGSVTSVRLPTRLISYGRLADAGFSFTLKKTPSIATTTPGPLRAKHFQYMKQRETRLLSTFTPVRLAAVGLGYPPSYGNNPLDDGASSHSAGLLCLILSLKLR